MDPRFTITPSLWDGLRQIDQLQGRFAGLPVSAEWRIAEQHRALLEEAVHTTRIEGSEITVEEAELLLTGRDAPSARPDDARELLNYSRAHAAVQGYATSGRPVTQAYVRELHRMLVEGVRGGHAAPGEYRRVQNYVVDLSTNRVIYTPPAANEIPVRMADLTTWLESPALHPALVAGVVQFELVDIHPFLDGNGRTARLLSLHHLYGAGYAFGGLATLSEFYGRNRAAYYSAIQSVRGDDRDHTRWFEFFVDGVHQRSLAAVERVAQSVGLRLAGEQALSPRQFHALSLAVSSGTLTIGALASSQPTTPRRTLQYDLQQLVQAGLLEAEGSTHRRRYRPAPALLSLVGKDGPGVIQQDGAEPHSPAVLERRMRELSHRVNAVPAKAPRRKRTRR